MTERKSLRRRIISLKIKKCIIFQVKVIENGEDFTRDLGMKTLEKKRFFMHAEDAALTVKEGA